MRSLAGGRCAQQVSDARRAASWQPFGDHARCNHDAIMIRLVSHQWHSASDERMSGQSARAASERSAGRLLAAPLGEQQRCNHDAIMIMMMNYRWQSAGDGSGRCSARSARAARERQPALPMQAQERGQRFVSEPSRRGSGGGRHTREGNQLRKSRAARGGLRRRSTRARAAACIGADARSITPARTISCEGGEMFELCLSASRCRSRTRAGEAACVDAEPTQSQWRDAREGD